MQTPEVAEIEKIVDGIKDDLVSGKITFQSQMARRSEYRAKAAESHGKARDDWLFRAEIIDAAMEDAKCELIRAGKMKLGQNPLYVRIGEEVA